MIERGVAMEGALTSAVGTLGRVSKGVKALSALADSAQMTLSASSPSLAFPSSLLFLRPVVQTCPVNVHSLGRGGSCLTAESC